MGRGLESQTVRSQGRSVSRKANLQRLIEGEELSAAEISALIWHRGGSAPLQPDALDGQRRSALFRGYHLASHLGVAVHYSGRQLFVKRDDGPGKRYVSQFKVKVENPFYMASPVDKKIVKLTETKIRESSAEEVGRFSKIFLNREDQDFTNHLLRVREGEEDLQLPERTSNFDLFAVEGVGDLYTDIKFSEDDLQELGFDSIIFFVNKSGPQPHLPENGQGDLKDDDSELAIFYAAELILFDPQKQIESFEEQFLGYTKNP